MSFHPTSARRHIAARREGRDDGVGARLVRVDFDSETSLPGVKGVFGEKGGFDDRR
jgi:hypothetical protein